MNKVMWSVLPMAIVLCCACGKSYTCDECGKTFHGDAYYDSFDEDFIMCASCAEEYYSPLPYSNFKLTGSRQNQDADVKEISTKADISSEKNQENYSIKAGSSFSEGKAFAYIYRNDGEEYAYIDSQGEIIFELPSGFTYGDEFHEGYAVITDWDYGKGKDHTALGHMYALIDEKGNIVIEPGIYDFIGRVSEGAAFTFVCEKDYKGNRIETKFVSPNNEEIFSVDPALVVEDYDEAPEYAKYVIHDIKNIYFIDGLVSMQGVNQAANAGDILVYDSKGNQVFFFEWLGDGDNARRIWNKPLGSEKTNYFLNAPNNWSKRDYPAGLFLIYDRKNCTINKYYPDAEFSTNQEAMADGYVMGYLKEKNRSCGVVVYDYQGSKISENRELDIESIRETDANYWVVELQNKYYGIMDQTSKLLFEPIQGKIVYVGEGKFYCDGTGDVIDATGTVLFNTPYDLKYGYAGYDNEYDMEYRIYKNGYIMVKDGKDYYYMDDNGKILNH